MLTNERIAEATRQSIYERDYSDWILSGAHPLEAHRLASKWADEAKRRALLALNADAPKTEGGAA